jgi:hypothetical protein
MKQRFIKVKELEQIFNGKVTIGSYGIFVEVKEDGNKKEDNKTE